MALTTELLNANWTRYYEGKLPERVGFAPAAAETEFFARAYVCINQTTGLAVRAISPDASSNVNLVPGGILTETPSFGAEPDNYTHHLDTRGQSNGVLTTPLEDSERLVHFFKGGLWFFNLYVGSDPKVGGKAYLITEQTVRSSPTTNGLWVGTFYRPHLDGWIVDCHESGVG